MFSLFHGRRQEEDEVKSVLNAWKIRIMKVPGAVVSRASLRFDTIERILILHYGGQSCKTKRNRLNVFSLSGRKHSRGNLTIWMPNGGKRCAMQTEYCKMISAGL